MAIKPVTLLVLLCASAPALADGVVFDCNPKTVGTVDESDGCDCSQKHTLHLCPPDLSGTPPDLARPPADLRSPADARRERKRARGRGLVLLSGMSALAVIALRRRYRTNRPTPAESALAASETRKQS